MNEIAEETVPAFTCPDWCTVDHEADGYLRHGHVVHRAVDVTPRGFAIEYWQTTVHMYREQIEPVQVHLAEFFTKFDDPEELRVFAEDMLRVADKLDKMNSYTP